MASTAEDRKKSVVKSDEFNNGKSRYLISEKYAPSTSSGQAKSEGRGGEYDYNGSNLDLELWSTVCRWK